ncbi:hypothetical protein BVX93_02150, partial [bacterium B13(2017)]
MNKNQFSEDIILYSIKVAAASLKNFWTKLASTPYCMQFILSKNHLIIKPRWFIGWLIKILFLDLYHVIPNEKVISLN